MKTFTKLIQRAKAFLLCTSISLVSIYGNAQCPVSDCDVVQNGSFENGNDGSYTSDLTDLGTILPSYSYGSYVINTNAHTANSGLDNVSAHCGSKFMIVDGNDNNLNPLVWRQSVNVTPGVTYTFSFYAIDVHYGYSTSHSPALVARINGIAQAPTGQLSNAWTQYCYTFTPSSSPAVLAIEQTIFEQDGNDYGIDCITCTYPCECKKCLCEMDMAQLTDVIVNPDGSSNGILNIGAPFPSVSKFRITLVNYHSNVDPECLKCDVLDQEKFGTLHDAPALYGTSPSYAPYDESIAVPYSHEVTWCFNPNAIFQPQPIPLQFTFPPVDNLPCCKNDVSFCLRVEFWDKDCKACDRLICWEGNSHVQPKSLLSTPEPKKIQETSKLKVIPNPASNNFKIVIDKENLNGTLQVFDLHGSLIKEAIVTSEDYTVSTKSFAEGMYLVRYKTAKGSLEEKVVIKK